MASYPQQNYHQGKPSVYNAANFNQSPYPNQEQNVNNIIQYPNQQVVNFNQNVNTLRQDLLINEPIQQTIPPSVNPTAPFEDEFKDKPKFHFRSKTLCCKTQYFWYMFFIAYMTLLVIHVLVTYPIAILGTILTSIEFIIIMIGIAGIWFRKSALLMTVQIIFGLNILYRIFAIIGYIMHLSGSDQGYQNDFDKFLAKMNQNLGTSFSVGNNDEKDGWWDSFVSGIGAIGGIIWSVLVIVFFVCMVIQLNTDRRKIKEYEIKNSQ